MKISYTLIGLFAMVAFAKKHHDKPTYGEEQSTCGPCREKIYNCHSVGTPF
jgi:hypothetical protein